MTNRGGEATGQLLEVGREALSRGAWEEARESFEAAIRERETAAALEGLSWAAWWLNDADVMFTTRELAFQRYRAEGELRGAARMALWLSSDHLDFRGEAAVANGWRERARRLLSGLEEGPEHGWLALLEGSLALEMNDDPVAGKELGARAAELGVRLGLIDLQMLGLAVEGLALVTEGHVQEGMRRLDEAVTAAVGGELQDIVSILFASCYLIYACERVRDYDREAQWCRRLEELAGRLRIRMLLGECRVHYGGVLMWHGAWRQAEEQLARAAADFAASRPLAAVESVARLAELRRRQGRLDEAEGLLEEVQGHHLSILGRAHLALDRGDVERAADLAERALRSLPEEDRTGRAAWLEVLACVRAVLGDHTEAAAAADELEVIAEAIGTDPLRASAKFAGGVATATTGDHPAARRLLEDATDLYLRCRAPFETARSRIELSGTLHAMGRTAAAIEELQKALRSLRELGAGHEAARAASRLSELGAPVDRGLRSGARSPALTTRQLDVLRLVAEGLSDKEIARRLVLSEHTVHRHIANILTRFGVPSRAAAVAQAKELALL
jgi:LuxR family transcriptional regulator, maltose regulon positive regulatory protein